MTRLLRFRLWLSAKILGSDTEPLNHRDSYLVFLDPTRVDTDYLAIVLDQLRVRAAIVPIIYPKTQKVEVIFKRIAEAA